MDITLEFCEKCAKTMILSCYDEPHHSVLKAILCKKCEDNLLKAFDEYREKVNNKDGENG